MSRVLVFFTASFPFGRGEAFVEHEMPYLARAYDHVVVVSNDTESPQTRALPDGVTCVRESYHLTPAEKLRSVGGLVRPAVLGELARVPRLPGVALGRPVVSTVLTSWRKAHRFSRLVRDAARRFPEARIHAYSYWANDMALAAAVARERGWADRALCRAHGWDVYAERAEAGFLPFRHHLARHLDHYLFVSDHGRRYFEERMGQSYPSLGRSRLGTPAVSREPLARRRPFTVVSCSNLIPLKRIELLARALALLPADLPVRWIHAGDGPTHGAVAGICRSLPEHVRAELLGALPNEEVLDLYRTRRPSVLVNVSAFEGLPVSMMEAMSAGVPVVGTQVGGVDEIVVHGRNGLLLPADPTPEDVAAAIAGLARLGEDEYRAYSHAAWTTWRENFEAGARYGAFLRHVGVEIDARADGERSDDALNAPHGRIP